MSERIRPENWTKERESASERLRPYLTDREWEAYLDIIDVVVALNDAGPKYVLHTNTTGASYMVKESRDIYYRLQDALPETWDVSPEEYNLGRI